MRHVLAALGTATLVIIAAPAVQASPVDTAVQSLTDQEVAYAKKGGWMGGRAWVHCRGWR